MNKKLVLLLCLLGSIHPAWAEIYKKVDENGHVTYSNVPIKGGVKLDLEPPVSTAPASPAAKPRVKTPTPANFPRVDKETQNRRDDKRKQILTEELESEKQALEDAKKAYAEGESTPEVYRTKDGKIRRNVPKYEEKMQRLQAEVEAHEKNIQLLQKELSTLD
ncbi:MAG TPA: DUF4124 domain-containing protein [Methylophilaceae bacterium]|nr:DUF4124 domain-containing protein [Methylophilaceae bacterium]